MSNSLTGYTPGETYGSLLTVSNFNDGVDSTLRFVYDGKGDASALKISTTDVDIAGTFNLNGVALTATAAELNTISTFGTMALQDANSVSITGGSITGITDIAVADGGTGASTATSARSNLGLVIGTDVQAHTSTLDAVSAGTYTGASSITTLGTITTGVWTGTNIAVANGGTGAATASSARTNLGLVIGTDVQAYSTVLSTVSSGTYTGSSSITTLGTITTGTWTGTTIATTNGGTGATTTASARSNLGLAIGTNVQAWDADLDAYAALSSTGVVIRTGSGTASVRTLTGTTDQVSISNGDGVSGNPTFSLPQSIATSSTVQFNIVKAGVGSASAPSYALTNDTNTGLYSSAADVLGIAAGGLTAMTITGTASAVNYLNVSSGTTGTTNNNAVAITVAGTDTDINTSIVNKGTGKTFFNNGIAVNAGTSTPSTLTKAHIFIASTDVQYTGERTGTNTGLMHWGGGGNGFTVYTSTPTMVFRIATTGDVYLCGSQGSESLRAIRTASAVNRLNVTGATTGNDVAVAAAGSDTDVSLTINAQAAGSVKSSSKWVMTSTQTTGIGFDHQTTTHTTGSLFRIYDNGTDTGSRKLLEIVNDNTSATGVTPLYIQQDAVTSTNFKRIISLDGVTLWKSNGTTPNGNLSGTAGDICFNGASSQAFYCTGTTNWTGM